MGGIMEPVTEEDKMATQKKVQQNFEIEEKIIKQLKKIAAQDERSVAYVFRKLAEQAVQAGTYQLIDSGHSAKSGKGSRVQP